MSTSKSRKSKSKYNDRNLRHIFPSWLILIYGAACGFLIPWTLFLSVVLPPRYITNHWDFAWAGFDVFEWLLFALTAVLTIRRSSWTALTATMLGTVLILDAWFDVLTARSGRDQYSATLEALFIELPLALVSFALAHRIFNYTRKHQLNP